MPDTHINAYYGDVDEKLRLVQIAQGEYQAAQDRLEAKKKELGISDNVAEEEPKKVEEPAEKPAEEDKSKLSFKKK